MASRIRGYFNKQRQKLGVFVTSTRHKLSNIKLAKVMRSRSFLLGVYVVIMVALAGVWYWNSPYRLSQKPLDLPEAPPIAHTPAPVESEHEPAQAVPEPDPVPEEPSKGSTENTIPPATEEPAIPVLSLNVAVDKLTKPVQGAVLAQYGFKWSKTYEDFRFHHGVGLATTQGTPVVAAYAGRVLSVTEQDPEWGSTVTIDHGSGWRTVYANVKASVRNGQTIKEGQQIGQVGPNPPAKSVDSPQLYFALYQGEDSVDPTHMFK